jgi:phage repressor protein C with HTH and peptisase S24 domain
MDRTSPSFQGERLKKAREAAGYETAQAAADRFGWNYDTYIQHERGQRGLSRSANRYALAYKVSAGWLLTGEGLGPSFSRDDSVENTTPSTGGTRGLFTVVPIAGYVGAGATVVLFEGDAAASIGYAKAPRALGAMEALIVRGDSMYPAYKDGDVIFYGNQAAELPIRFPDEYVVKLSDGRVLLKEVVPSGNGGYVLQSHNAPPIFGAEIVEAFEIRWIQKRRNARMTVPDLPELPDH